MAVIARACQPREAGPSGSPGARALGSARGDEDAGAGEGRRCPRARPSISTVVVPSGDAAVTVPAWPGSSDGVLEELEQARG